MIHCDHAERDTIKCTEQDIEGNGWHINSVHFHKYIDTKILNHVFHEVLSQITKRALSHLLVLSQLTSVSA